MKNKFDQYLNKQLDQLPETFDPADWNGVEAMLDKDKKKKALWWYFVLPAVTILTGIGAYMVFHDNDLQVFNSRQVTASITIPKNIIRANEPREPQKSLQENNSQKQIANIKPVVKNNIYHNNINILTKVELKYEYLSVSCDKNYTIFDTLDGVYICGHNDSFKLDKINLPYPLKLETNRFKKTKSARGIL